MAINRRQFFGALAGGAVVSKLPAPTAPLPISGISIARKVWNADDMLVSPSVLKMVGTGRNLFNPAIDVKARYEEARKVILARIGASH